jgi:hypothetical protein
VSKGKTLAQKFRDIFARFTSGSTADERTTAEAAMDRWLKRHGKGRLDIPAILAQAVTDDAAAAPPPPSDPRDAASAEPVDPDDTLLSPVCKAFKNYLALNSHEYVAMALWAMHTHVYDRYMVTPRLLLTSPVRGCGKSVGFDVLDRLVARAYLTDNITAAAIYDTIDRALCTLLMDEFDNQELATKAAMRAVLNAGYRKGRKVTRGVGKQRREYRIFAPVAIAAIGTLPLPLMSRSLIVRMKRHDGSYELQRFDRDNTDDLDRVYVQIREWAHYVKLDPNPKLPPELRGRDADNWRPLIAIADSFGPEWGRIARAAAVLFAQDRREEDVVVILLQDIRTVFDARGIDRIASKALLAALHELEDAGWTEFCGLKGDRPPHKLRASELRAMLRLLGIETHSIWDMGPRQSGDSSKKGYYRSDFEPAWAAYCDAAGTSAQSAAIRQLRGA